MKVFSSVVTGPTKLTIRKQAVSEAPPSGGACIENTELENVLLQTTCCISLHVLLTVREGVKD